MDTHFATPERLDEHDLSIEINLASQNPVMSVLLKAVSGLLAVLNEHRQIISLNDGFLKMLGVEDPKKALGLRLGEVLECIHAHDEPSGCGTTQFCTSCGTAIATVTSLSENRSSERICALSTIRDGKAQDLSLLVRSHPITIAEKRFLLLFIQDITQQQNRSALERTFFHDINNMLGMLLGASELLISQHPSNLSTTIHQGILRLSKEVTIQQCLSRDESASYQTLWADVTTQQVLEDLAAFFQNHSSATNKEIRFPDTFENTIIRTDISLLLRVLCNMVINALEASQEGEKIAVEFEKADTHVKFHVWNRQFIPENIALRIFQRNFTTKQQAGRGIGTFSMKLFGEKILGGKVNFTTSKEEGTRFTYTIPL